MQNKQGISKLLTESVRLLSLNESILDPVNNVRCREIFDENDVMKPEVESFIKNAFELWYKQLNVDLKTFKILGYKIIGSSTGYQYSSNSDVDAQVIVEMLPNHEFRETWQLIKILPNGNNVPGTEHPVNYFLVDINNPTDMNKVENMYDITTKKWEKKSELKDIKIPVLYVKEIARFFTDAFDLLLGRYERDKQYLKDSLKLNPEIQDISKSEKDTAVNDCIKQLKADLDSMRLAEKLIHGFRLQAYDENNFFHISINYMDDDDPRRSMNEAIYKTLDKFEYREKLKTKIDEGYSIIDSVEKEINKNG